jgi:polyisoprenoid-binding protein YceI
MRRLFRWARRRWMFVIPGLVLAVLGSAKLGAIIYTRFINDPAPTLTFANRDKELQKATTTISTGVPPSTKVVAEDSLDGTWTVTKPSTAGYRIKESISGESSEGVGRTTTVDGAFVLAGETVTEAEFNVDVSTLTSDQSKRDEAVSGDILKTEEFPVATFTLTEPIVLGAIPADGVAVKAKATGTMSLRGMEAPMVLDVEARRSGQSIEVAANGIIVFADFGIPDPSKKPLVTVENRGTLEVLLTLKR